MYIKKLIVTFFVFIIFGCATKPDLSLYKKIKVPEIFKKRRFAFDKPFLVTLWKKNDLQPYLALWVANDDILLPFSQNKCCILIFLYLCNKLRI